MVMEEVSKEETVKRWQQLKQVVQLLVGQFREIPDTDYLVCAVTRGKRILANGDEEPVCFRILSSNLNWTDIHGNRQPPTIGVMTDLLVEAHLTPGEEIFERFWDERQPP